MLTAPPPAALFPRNRTPDRLGFAGVAAVTSVFPALLQFRVDRREDPQSSLVHLLPSEALHQFDPHLLLEVLSPRLVPLQPVVQHDRLYRAALDKDIKLSTAEIAGVMAAKRTAELIPLCHSLPRTWLTVAAMVAAVMAGCLVATVKCSRWISTKPRP